MIGQIRTKHDFMELMMGVLTAKLNATVCNCTYCEQDHMSILTADEISFISTVADNIYTFAVADGMNRAFEALRRDAKLPENSK